MKKASVKVPPSPRPDRKVPPAKEGTMLQKSNKSGAGEQAGRDLPPWNARDQRDNDLMAQWLNDRLDEVQKGVHDNLTLDNDPQFAFFWEETQARRRAGGKEIYEAQQGNIEPLRELVRKHIPALAEFIHLPKQPGKGKRFQKSEFNVERAIFTDPKKRALTFAAWDVATIRDLWERHYGKKKRSNPSAEDFAAARHKVEVNELCEWTRSRQLPKDRHREKKRNYIFGSI
jgi:hypothetical protein